MNSAGGTYTVSGGNYYGFNIGEPIATTAHNGPGTNYYTQGFLQPDYKIGTAFVASAQPFSESCQNAGDGFIVVSTANNVGPVTLTINSGATPTGNAIMNLQPGTYTVTVADTAGHYLVKVVTIQASTAECEDTVYHAFSPNGDGLNDLFIISGIERFADNHVYFFNRWGQLVWDHDKYDNVKVVWDGKDNNGATLTSGTYFYVIDRKGKKAQKSWVEITR
jgi:gliding motility-associated-like protein